MARPIVRADTTPATERPAAPPISRANRRTSGNRISPATCDQHIASQRSLASKLLSRPARCEMRRALRAKRRASPANAHYRFSAPRAARQAWARERSVVVTLGNSARVAPWPRQYNNFAARNALRNGAVEKFIAAPRRPRPRQLRNRRDQRAPNDQRRQHDEKGSSRPDGPGGKIGRHPAFFPVRTVRGMRTIPRSADEPQALTKRSRKAGGDSAAHRQQRCVELAPIGVAGPADDQKCRHITGRDQAARDTHASRVPPKPISARHTSAAATPFGAKARMRFRFAVSSTNGQPPA